MQFEWKSFMTHTSDITQTQIPVTTRPSFTTVDEYLAAAADQSRPILELIRSTVRMAVPDATECISYQMPALRLKKVFFYYGAFRHHIGIYPPVKGAPKLEAELERFRGPKGNLIFPLNKPIPYALIERVAETLAAEHR
jgi:uncharacterized protein YdhG (YjbR/CyaY superfamily)